MIESPFFNCSLCKKNRQFGIKFHIDFETGFNFIFICESCIKQKIEENKFYIRFLPKFLADIIKKFK